ncbi:hypothetical protein BH23BAC3_BH23BAC3_19740 [soil metagenome]
MNTKVTDYINSAPEDQKKIMGILRRLIHQSVKNVSEEYKWSRPVFCSDKDFAYLKTAKKHVTLGFFNFEKINDKDNQLEGSGKEMRHVKIKSMNDVDEEKLKDWITAVAKL